VRHQQAEWLGLQPRHEGVARGAQRQESEQEKAGPQQVPKLEGEGLEADGHEEGRRTHCSKEGDGGVVGVGAAGPHAVYHDLTQVEQNSDLGNNSFRFCRIYQSIATSVSNRNIIFV
jgi:hypothetical protein